MLLGGQLARDFFGVGCVFARKPEVRLPRSAITALMTSPSVAVGRFKNRRGIGIGLVRGMRSGKAALAAERAF